MVENQSNPAVTVPEPEPEPEEEPEPEPIVYYKGVIGTGFETTDGIIAFLRRSAKPELEELLGEELDPEFGVENIRGNVVLQRAGNYLLMSREGATKEHFEGREGLCRDRLHELTEGCANVAYVSHIKPDGKIRFDTYEIDPVLTHDINIVGDDEGTWLTDLSGHRVRLPETLEYYFPNTGYFPKPAHCNVDESGMSDDGITKLREGSELKKELRAYTLSRGGIIPAFGKEGGVRTLTLEENLDFEFSDTTTPTSEEAVELPPEESWLTAKKVFAIGAATALALLSFGAGIYLGKNSKTVGDYDGEPSDHFLLGQLAEYNSNVEDRTPITVNETWQSIIQDEIGESLLIGSSINLLSESRIEIYAPGDNTPRVVPFPHDIYQDDGYHSLFLKRENLLHEHCLEQRIADLENWVPVLTQMIENGTTSADPFNITVSPYFASLISGITNNNSLASEAALLRYNSDGKISVLNSEGTSLLEVLPPTRSEFGDVAGGSLYSLFINRDMHEHGEEVEDVVPELTEMIRVGTISGDPFNLTLTPFIKQAVEGRTGYNLSKEADSLMYIPSSGWLYILSDGGSPIDVVFPSQLGGGLENVVNTLYRALLDRDNLQQLDGLLGDISQLENEEIPNLQNRISSLVNVSAIDGDFGWSIDPQDWVGNVSTEFNIKYSQIQLGNLENHRELLNESGLEDLANEDYQLYIGAKLVSQKVSGEDVTYSFELYGVDTADNRTLTISDIDYNTLADIIGDGVHNGDAVRPITDGLHNSIEGLFHDYAISVHQHYIDALAGELNLTLDISSPEDYLELAPSFIEDHVVPAVDALMESGNTTSFYLTYSQMADVYNNLSQNSRDNLSGVYLKEGDFDGNLSNAELNLEAPIYFNPNLGGSGIVIYSKQIRGGDGEISNTPIRLKGLSPETIEEIALLAGV